MTDAPGNHRIGWFADRVDQGMASIRLRMLSPIEILSARGFDVAACPPQPDARDYHTVVFSKAFSGRAVRFAQAVREAGGRIVFDICDNVFASSYRPDQGRRKARLRAMLEIADVITVATDELARQITAAVPGLIVPCHVLPDMIPPLSLVPDEKLAQTERKHLDHLDQFLARHPQALHCVWFGKSQGRLAGLSHLGRIVDLLRQRQRKSPTTLTIINNQRWRYALHRVGWRGVPVHFLPWSLGSFGAALARHEIALIPLEQNAYTLGKTINRPATALLAGLGVVADTIPAYEELSRFIFLDDWERGLDHYAQIKPSSDQRVAGGRAHVQERYSPQVVGDAWQDLLGLRDHPQSRNTGKQV